MQPTDRLSPHIAAVEFVAGSRADQRGTKWADRLPLMTAERTAEARRLCAVLELVRELAGKPVWITSGIRPGIGSQHCHGQAADIQIRGMSPRELIRLIWQHRERMPHKLRQVIAESLHTDPASLDRPMDEGSGVWVHVAILGAPGQRYATRTDAAWLASTAPTSGKRVYAAWSPPGAA